MIAAVEHDLYRALGTFRPAAKVLAFIFHAQDPDIHWQDQEKIHQILLGMIYYHFVHIPAGSQLYLSFHYRLYRPVLGIRPVYGGISLESTDEIIAMIFCLTQHGDMSGMQHVKGAEGDADTLAFGLEALDVIEYHGYIEL